MSTTTILFTAIIASLQLAACEETVCSSLLLPLLPLSYSSTVIEGGEQVCPPDETLQMARAEINSDVRTHLLSLVPHGQDDENPATSCQQILQCYPNSQSGYYWISSSNGTAVQIYCDMSRTCCNSTGGWSRVAYLDMADPTHQCPPAWTEITNPVRTCTLTDTTNTVGTPSCSSAYFSTHGIPYSQVCGSVIGYQRGGTKAFQPYIDSEFTSIDEPYVYGVVITHGTERQHIWTFATAFGELEVWYQSGPTWVCPCTGNATTMDTIPPFVGENYFCESGAPGGSVASIFYSSDPLWDGESCAGNACCDFNTPPYFCSQLPEATTDDIEIRICGYFNADSPIELIELYTR